MQDQPHGRPEFIRFMNQPEHRERVPLERGVSLRGSSLFKADTPDAAVRANVEGGVSLPDIGASEGA